MQFIKYVICNIFKYSYQRSQMQEVIIIIRYMSKVNILFCIYLKSIWLAEIHLPVSKKKYSVNKNGSHFLTFSKPTSKKMPSWNYWCAWSNCREFFINSSQDKLSSFSNIWGSLQVITYIYYSHVVIYNFFLVPRSQTVIYKLKGLPGTKTWEAFAVNNICEQVKFSSVNEMIKGFRQIN